MFPAGSGAEGDVSVAPWSIATALCAFAGLAVVSGTALEAVGSPLLRLAPVGVVIAAIGWAAMWTEHALFRGAEDDGSTRSVGALVGALALVVTGCVVATADPQLLLISAAIATWTALRVAFRLARPAAMWPGLVASVVTYFLPPGARA